MGGGGGGVILTVKARLPDSICNAPPLVNPTLTHTLHCICICILISICICMHCIALQGTFAVDTHFGLYFVFVFVFVSVFVFVFVFVFVSVFALQRN